MEQSNWFKGVTTAKKLYDMLECMDLGMLVTIGTHKWGKSDCGNYGIYWAGTRTTTNNGTKIETSFESITNTEVPLNTVMIIIERDLTEDQYVRHTADLSLNKLKRSEINVR